jgi:hypothetical protein
MVVIDRNGNAVADSSGQPVADAVVAIGSGLMMENGTGFLIFETKYFGVVIPVTYDILMESGGFLLLNNGAPFELEAAP